MWVSFTKDSWHALYKVAPFITACGVEKDDALTVVDAVPIAGKLCGRCLRILGNIPKGEYQQYEAGAPRCKRKQSA